MKNKMDSPVEGNAFGGLMAKNLDAGMSKSEAAANAAATLKQRTDSAASYKNFGVSASPSMMNLMGKSYKK